MDFELQQVRTFHMRQRVTFMVNRYEIRADDGKGRAGEVVAFAQQKRATLKERVTLYADAGKNQVIGGFKARSVIDLGSGYDVTDASGARIGNFRKAFGISLARSTWHLEQPGVGVFTGSERSMPVAIMRRLWEAIPLVREFPFFVPYHFDFKADGKTVLSVERKIALRDSYLIKVFDERLDSRVVFAQAVALDALQSR